MWVWKKETFDIWSQEDVIKWTMKIKIQREKSRNKRLNFFTQAFICNTTILFLFLQTYLTVREYYVKQHSTNNFNRFWSV